MIEDLQKKLQAALVSFVVIPFSALCLVATLIWAKARYHQHLKEFNSRAEEARLELEAAIRTEIGRLMLITRLPVVSAVAQTASRGGEEAARQADRGTMEPASVGSQEVSDLFKRLAGTDSTWVAMLLLDSSGVILAASDSALVVSPRSAPWWQAVQQAGPAGIVSTGIDPAGRMDVVVPVFRPGRLSIVDGHVFAQINLEAAIRGRLASSQNRALMVLGAEEPWIVGGVASAGDAAIQLAETLHAQAEPTGHRMGYRYRILPIDAGVSWSRPIRLAVAVRDPVLPMAVLLPPLAFLFSGLALAAGSTILAVWLARSRLLEPIQDTLEAGAWVLKTALGRGKTSPKSSALQKELAAWHNKLLEDAQRNQAVLSEDVARDLELATEFQQAFLNRPYPEIPEVHLPGRLRLEFAHRYHAALAMGGDFFDITALASDTAGLFVGDVMGHGTRSALIVAILRTLIAEQSRRGRNAPHFLRELNNEFCKLLKALPSPIFASAAYFVADTTSRVATYSVAGHPPPFHLHRPLGRVSRLEMPKPHGVALGLVPGEEYGGGTVRLNDGDAFIFFTDGVYEASNRKGEEFGLNRFEKVLRSNVYRSSHEILDAVMNAVIQFTDGQPLADDICLVAVDIKTDARPGTPA